MNYNDEETKGKTATLYEPYKGYRSIVLIEKNHLKWTVELSSGKLIEVYEDEFYFD